MLKNWLVWGEKKHTSGVISILGVYGVSSREGNSDFFS